MKRTTFIAAAAAAVVALGLMGASGPRAAVAADAQPGGVHAITLPTMQPDLPDGPGKDLVMANCILCHSTRYITMQPAFSKDFWTTEVNKMRKTFGAPVAEEKVEDIVNYLVSIRGK